MRKKRRAMQQRQPLVADSTTRLQDRFNGLKGVMNMDAFMNTMARTGWGMPNMMEGTSYPLTRMGWDYITLNSLYRSNWLARRIIDTIPKDMLKNGHKYTCEIKPEEVDKVQREIRTTRILPALLKSLNYGRLYGGAGALMMIEGQEDKLDQPLDLDEILPGDFKGLMIVDRWSGIYPMMELVEDISSPEFGLPKYYEFRNLTTKEVFKVHHSRIIRFTGLDLPEWERQADMYWGCSIIENVYEEIKKRDNTSANIANLIFRANLRIMKIKDLDVLLGGTNKKAAQDMYNVIQAQNWLMSNSGVQLMSAEDDFINITNSFSELDQIYECFMMDVSGAAQIPVTKLFGRSPAGMNATGESDLINYYDVVKHDQEAILRPALEKILPVLFLSTLGYIPDDFDFQFNPIYTPSDKELGDSTKWKTEAILGLHDRGIISDQRVLQEAKLLSDTTGIFTSITDEDIDSASEKPVGPPLPDDEGGPGAEKNPEELEKLE